MFMIVRRCTELQNVRKSMRRFNRRQGAMLVFIAILLPAVLAVCAYAINVVYMELARTEIQISIDLASRAAARSLAQTGDQSQATAQAQRLLDANPCLNNRIVLTPEDVMFGVATRLREEDRYTFTEGAFPNAIQLHSHQKFDLPILFPTSGVPIAFRPLKSTISAQTEMDVAFVLDRSTSMAFPYEELSDEASKLPAGWKPGFPVLPNARWTNMVAAIATCIQFMSDSKYEEQISLTTFGDEAKVDSQLTCEYERIAKSLAQYSNQFDGGRSDLSLGMISAATTLADGKRAKKWASRVLVVISDGNSTSTITPSIIASELAGQGVVIYTITCSADANTLLMNEIATIGGGKHFHSTNASEFIEAFSEISRSLPTVITN